MSDREPDRAPIFDYASAVDPAMSAFGWRYIVLAYAAVLVPLLGILLPRDGDTRWGVVIAVLGVAVATMALNARYLRQMFATAGWSEPSPMVVLIQALVVTVSIGALNYALSGLGGFYRPVIFVPTMLIAVLGNRAMVVTTGAVALASLLVSSWAQGVELRHIPVLAVSYGVTWGVLVVMFRLVSSHALGATHLTQGIADAAAVTASADGLDDGLQRLLPVIGAWAEADRVTVFVVDAEDTTLFDHWPIGSAPCEPPRPEVVEQALRESGAAIDGSTGVLVANSTVPGQLVVAVVDGSPRSRFESVTYLYQLVRMADQFATLVTRSQHIAHLEALSSTDGLTGLPNRRALEERLELERSLALQRGDPLSLVMIDLDDFKRYNDTHGHPAGDDLLRRFADVLRGGVRTADFVARYGGEEFCILLPATTGVGAEALTTHLRKQLSTGDEADRTAFSAGIATWCAPETNQELLTRADSALYAAKEEGKDRTIVS